MAEKPGELDNKVLIETEKRVEIVDLKDSRENAYPVESRADISPAAVKSVPETLDDPETIRAHIEETRAEMSETIDAIQEKLSYDRISKQVKAEVSEYVSETIETAKNTVYDTVLLKIGEIMHYTEQGLKEVADTEVVRTARRNPTAFTLIGLGVAALLIRGMQKNKPDYSYDHEEIVGRNYSRPYPTRGGKSSLSSAQDKLSSAAGSVSDTVGEAAESVSSSLSSAAGTVSDTVSSAASSAYKQVGNLGSYAKDAAGTVQEQIEEHPLAVGAVAAALGVAVGFSFPSTNYENRLMGEARNNLMLKAQESAREAVGKVQEVAGQVKETVQQEAKAQGLA